MGKSGKGDLKPSGKAGQKPEAVDDKASSRTDNVKNPAAPAGQTVNAEGKPSPKGFDVAAYVNSFAWVYPAVLVLVMALMFYIRAVPSHDLVFTHWAGNYVNFAQDDAVYQMRLVFNTLAHFPSRIFYDPFTHFPFGSEVHFGPLFTLIIAGSALVAGLGHPSAETVTAVAAYVPVVLGMLCAIPTYFIGRKLYGRNAGIIAAVTLALLPGQFLARSMLGFTDHHVAEVLFSVMAVAFLVYALDMAKESELNIEKIKGKDKKALTALGMAVFAGISFGMYVLVWPGALLVGMILFIYFVIQAVIDHIKGNSMDYMVIVAAALYLVPTIMVLPYSLMNLRLELMFYSLTQPLFLCIALVGILIIYGLSHLLKKNKAESWAFPVALVGIGVIGLLVAYIIFPQIYALTVAGLKVFTPTGGMLWVEEAKPSYIDQSGQFTFDFLWTSFFWSFWISIIALVMLAFRVIKNNRPAEWLFLIWNLIMLWSALAQIRFTYYFAVNAALLTAYFIYAVYQTFDWDKFVENWRKQVKTTEGAKKYIGDKSGQVLLYAILAVVFLIVITWPATSLSTGAYKSYDPIKNTTDFAFTGYTEAYSQMGSGMGSEWYNTLLWLRDHTPDPQGTTVSSTFDFMNGTYTEPPNGSQYDYPPSAYGVMSWWDYGHIITYVAHRIPNANPFQAGINENNSTEGSAPFFLATSEDKGYKNLQDMGSKYVVIDNPMATGKFTAITVWANDQDGWYSTINIPTFGQNLTPPVDSQKFKDSMMNRLYYDDADQMSHFRLVYESPGSYYIGVKLLYMDSYQINPYAQATNDNYTQAFGIYANFINPAPASQDSTLVGYDSRPPVKYVKIYEVVKGATITGQASPGAKVTANLTLSTDGRKFPYTQTTTADQSGSYSMIVPYATTAMNGTGYSSDVSPVGKYTLTVGNTTTPVEVPESAIQNGGTIKP
ncbi:MAG TPA: oligosaccharyl transferase, archaeosortase A system-associated [Methanocella sp.]|nr:oligosaccharyl transferase, archaeosortase A system-associated [Methanocella sp.]